MEKQRRPEARLRGLRFDWVGSWDGCSPTVSRLVALQSCRLPESAISCPSRPPRLVLVFSSSTRYTKTTTHEPTSTSVPAGHRPSVPAIGETPSARGQARHSPPPSLRGVQSCPRLCIVLLLLLPQHLQHLRLSWLGASQHILPPPRTTCHERRPHRRRFDSSNLTGLPAAHGTPRRLRECLRSEERRVGKECPV